MRRSRPAVVVAWANAAASVVLVGWAVPVAVGDGLTWQRFVYEPFGFSVVLVATMPILGAFVVTRHPQNRLGWVFCAYGPLRGVWVVANVWAHHTYVTEPGSWPGGPVAALLFQVGLLFLLPTVPLTLLWFPDGHPPPGRWRRVELTSAGAVVLIAGALIFGWPYRGERLLDPSPAVDGWSAAVVSGCIIGVIVLVLLGIVGGFASLISRLRRAEPDVRAQVKWFLFGVAATFVLNVIGDLGSAVAPLRVAAVVVLELFIVVGIERYRLWEIDRLINRTVVYGTLTAVAAAVYASAAISIGLVVGGAGSRSPLAVAGATLLIAVLFAPARRRIQLAVDRRFDRRTFDAVAQVRGFASRLGHDTPDPDELQGLLVEVLRDPDLVLSFATSGSRFIDHSGTDVDPPAESENRAVTLLGSAEDPVGVVGHRRSLNGEGRLLSDVLAAARSSVEYARLQAELRVQLVAIRGSRVRLVEATDAERRRIERDLHDGAQQRLVALALRVRTEQHRHVVAPGTPLDRVLSATVDELQAAVADLRSMTHGMLPPVLTTGGVGPALRELTSRYDGQVGLLGVPDHRHPPLVEGTAWFVANEGLTNAIKHATPADVTLRAGCQNGFLRVEVCDDGPGGATLDGSGLRGLTDRVDACGGRLILSSPPGGGTRLIAELPCE